MSGTYTDIIFNIYFIFKKYIYKKIKSIYKINQNLLEILSLILARNNMFCMFLQSKKMITLISLLNQLVEYFNLFFYILHSSKINVHYDNKLF